MIFVRKREKGLYDVRDILGSRYFVEDSRREDSMSADMTDEEWEYRERWIVWNVTDPFEGLETTETNPLQEEEPDIDGMSYLASESTMQECLALIGMWCAAAQIGD